MDASRCFQILHMASQYIKLYQASLFVHRANQHNQRNLTLTLIRQHPGSLRPKKGTVFWMIHVKASLLIAIGWLATMNKEGSLDFLNNGKTWKTMPRNVMQFFGRQVPLPLPVLRLPCTNCKPKGNFELKGFLKLE